MKQSENYKPLTIKSARNLAAPQTWAASVLPALFADFYCWQNGLGLTWTDGILLLAACVFLQSSVNTLNDYFDFVKGVDSESDHVEVSDAVLIYEKINPRSALLLGIAYLAAGAALGLMVCAGKGMVPLAAGLIGAAAVLLYSGGPVPVSHFPAGELVSGFVMGGLIPVGIAGCADGKMHWDILVSALPLILGIGLIMMTNNGSDIEKDREAGRKTFPACAGREKTVRIYRALIVIWLCLACVMAVILSGAAGIVTLLLAAAGRGTVRKQLACTLKPAERIAAMGGIAKTNILLNGAYTAAFIAGSVLKVLESYYG